MAISPGTNVGDTTNIGGVEYEWDGDKWNKVPTGIVGTLDTSEIALANPTKAAFNAIQQGTDLYPDTSGAITQEDANISLVAITDWLRLHRSESIVQSGVPDHTLYNDGALWVDDTTYKLYVLEGDNWIELTQSFDDTIQTLSGYMKRSEYNLEMTSYDTRVVADQKFTFQAYMTHMLDTSGDVLVHGFNGPEFDNVIRRLIDVERHQVYIEDKLDEILNSTEGHPPAEATSGQWTYIGYAQGNPGVTNWGTSNIVNDFTQISQVTINENSIDGRVFDLTSYEVGDVIDIHKYNGDDPVIGADYSVSAAFTITGKQISTGWARFDVTIIPNSQHGVVQVGDNFSFEKRRTN